MNNPNKGTRKAKRQKDTPTLSKTKSTSIIHLPLFLLTYTLSTATNDWIKDTKNLPGVVFQKLKDKEITADPIQHSIATTNHGSVYSLTNNINSIARFRFFASADAGTEELQLDIKNSVYLSKNHMFVLHQKSSSEVNYKLFEASETEYKRLSVKPGNQNQGGLKNQPIENNFFTQTTEIPGDRLIAVFNGGLQILKYSKKLGTIMAPTNQLHPGDLSGRELVDGILVRGNFRYNLVGIFRDKNTKKNRIGIMVFDLEHKDGDESQPVIKYHTAVTISTGFHESHDMRVVESGIKQGSGVWNEMEYAKTFYFISWPVFGASIATWNYQPWWTNTIVVNGNTRLDGLTAVPKTAFGLVIVEEWVGDRNAEWTTGRINGKIVIASNVRAKVTTTWPYLHVANFSNQRNDIRFGQLLSSNERGELVMLSLWSHPANIVYTSVIYNAPCASQGQVTYHKDGTYNQFVCTSNKLLGPNKCKTLSDPISMGCSECHNIFNGVEYQLFDAPNFWFPWRKICIRKDVKCLHPLYYDKEGANCYDCATQYNNCEICKHFDKECLICKTGYSRTSSNSPPCYDCSKLDPNCQDCRENDWGTEFTCKGCRSGYYLQAKNKCSECLEGCERCHNREGCGKCLPQYVLTDQENGGRCIPGCSKAGEYYDGKECKACATQENPHCSKCEKITGKCLECSEGFGFFEQGSGGSSSEKCRQRCSKIEYWTGEPQNKCQECDFFKLGDGCSGCEDKTGICSECKEGYQMVDDFKFCKKVCYEGEYYLGQLENKCSRCDSSDKNYHCSECKDGSGECLKCNKGYIYTKNQTCVKDCPEGTHWGGRGDDRCLACSKKNKGCSECEQIDGRCKTCLEDYSLGDDSTCQKVCLANQY